MQSTHVEIQRAQIVRELGPIPSATVHGVTFDGTHVWACVGYALLALDPETGAVARTLDVAGSAGTAFDGRFLYQLAGEHILTIDPKTGEERARIPAPGKGKDAGLTWAEGSLWVGQMRDRTIVEIDPKTGAILRTVRSDRFVTGVTFGGGALWHGTWEDNVSELRRVDVDTSEVQERIALPEGMVVTGLEADGDTRFFCGGGQSGKVRVVARRKAP